MTYRARVQRMDCGLRGCAMCAVMIACQISHHWFCLPQVNQGFGVCLQTLLNIMTGLNTPWIVGPRV